MAILKDLTVYGATRLISDTFAADIYSDGFHHNAHNNDDHVLLAGGGHKPLVDFEITVTNSAPTLGTSAKTIATIGGTAITASVDHVRTTITAGTAGTSTATSGLSFSIPYVTMNAYGHVTGYGTHTHTIDISGLLSAYVKLDAGAAEQTIKSSISSLSKGVINLWRNSGDHYTFLGFSNGSTETYLGGIGFKSQSDHNLYKKDGSNYYKIADANNITNPVTNITTTEQTIATIAGVNIKAKITVTNSAPTLGTTAKTIATIGGTTISAKVDHVSNTVTTTAGTATTGLTISIPHIVTNSVGHVTNNGTRTHTISFSDFPSMYWADQSVSNTSSNTTTPRFARIGLGTAINDSCAIHAAGSIYLNGGTSTEYCFISQIGRAKSGGGGWASNTFQVRDSSGTGLAWMGYYGTATTLEWIYIGSGAYNAKTNLRIDTSGYTTAKGYKKFDSSDSYVLLGNGGHKAISDFATSGHTHTFAAITTKITNTNEFNFVDVEQASIWFNYRRASNSAGTTATTNFYFGQGKASSTTYAYVNAEGFKKRGSSASYVLLGNGGHKAISDFATSGHTHNWSEIEAGSNSNGSFNITDGNLWVGILDNTTAERQIGLQSGAGNLYLFSQASTTGYRGLYVAAHGTGTAKSIISIDTNNNAAFYGTATYANDSDLLDGYHAGNASGNIPISNGTLNTNLYAEYAHCLHFSSCSNPANAYLDSKNVKWYANINSTASGSTGYAGVNAGFPVSNNANGILWLGTHNGSSTTSLFGGQVGISSNGNIYYRFISSGSFPTTANGGSWVRLLTSGNLNYTTSGKNYKVQADTNNNLYVNVPWTDENTHWTSNLRLGAINTTTTAATTNGNTYLKLVENNTVRATQIKIIGTGSVSVSSNASGVLTINGTDNNTDTKVTQTEGPGNYFRPIILGYTSKSNTNITSSFSDANPTNKVYYSNSLFVNGASGEIINNVDAAKGGLSLYAYFTKYGSLSITNTGTTTIDGITTLELGNSTYAGIPNNSKGVIKLWSNSNGGGGNTAYYYQIMSEDFTHSTNTTAYLPDVNSTKMYIASIPSKTQVGGPSTPVYADANGTIKECSSSLPSSVSLQAGTTDSKKFTVKVGNLTSNEYIVESIYGRYTSSGGQQNPNYFGTNKVGFLMMNTTVNSNTQYKDWMIMDCYNNNDVGGAVAFGVNRQSLGAYIMRSAATRTSWAESAELLGTHNYDTYTIKKGSSTTSTRIAYFSAANTISAGSITSDGTYLGRVNYLTINGAHQTSYRFYVNGTSWLGGTTHQRGTIYLASGTTYWIDNSAVGYLSELRASKVRLANDWVGFYKNVNAGGSRYGYIQAVQNTFNFIGENQSSGAFQNFYFNGNITASTIELSSSTPYIDFHYGSSTVDFTSRIIDRKNYSESTYTRLWLDSPNNEFRGFLATTSGNKFNIICLGVFLFYREPGATNWSWFRLGGIVTLTAQTNSPVSNHSETPSSGQVGGGLLYQVSTDSSYSNLNYTRTGNVYIVSVSAQPRGMRHGNYTIYNWQGWVPGNASASTGGIDVYIGSSTTSSNYNDIVNNRCDYVGFIIRSTYHRSNDGDLASMTTDGLTEQSNMGINEFIATIFGYII